MGAREKIHAMVEALPDEQVNEVLNFVEFLQQKAQSGTALRSAIPKGTLTGLRGIAKRSGMPPTDEEIREEYTDYLAEADKPLDFRQAAGLGQDIWQSVDVEQYIQQERVEWD